MSNYESLVAQFQEKLKFAPDFKKRIKLIVEDEGDKTIIIDATDRPTTVSYDVDEDTDVTLTAKLAVFEGLVNGTQDPNMAFMLRKLKIKGSMGVAMRLNSILED